MAKRLAIVGDVLLDRDINGEVHRIAPDAPAPVLDESGFADRPGGAGLAAMLAAADGHDVTLITALSDDAGGARLSDLLTAAGVTVIGLAVSGPTAEKVRFRAGGQVLMRWDRGGPASTTKPAPPCPDALAALRAAEAVVVSDYGRGVTRQQQLREALADISAPVVWDPHPGGGPAIAGVSLLSPNMREVEVLTGVRGVPQLGAVAHGARRLRDQWRAAAVAVTMGSRGALVALSAPTPQLVHAPRQSAGDPCGAGDQFAVAAAVALAEGCSTVHAVQRAVSRATTYVADGGVATLLRTAADPSPLAPSPLLFDGRQDAAGAAAVVSRVRAAGGVVVGTGGCFDLLHAGHVATLETARALGDCLIVCLNSDESVRVIKGPARPLMGQNDRARLLKGLSSVDAVVVFDETEPDAVLSWLRPDIWVKGGDYSDPAALPESELIAGWGGQSVVVPYVDGLSTTQIIAAARAPDPSGTGQQSVAHRQEVKA
ncbi:PfkB family carbohydrate kinase [Pilimelia columellifera]|uniref:PfkB family carbohydrate kinase n=1 Tax=Pilimelia columellifera subsp. columellifera TaxID=706583 RepID=A0ABP6ALU0_9ACTN